MGTQYVFFGAGGVGLDAARMLRRAGIDIPVAFTDNDPSKWNRFIEGVEVLCPQEAFTRFREATFVATASDDLGVEIYQQMLGMKLTTRPIRYVELRKTFPEVLFPSQAPSKVRWMLNHWDYLLTLKEQLADRLSQNEFTGQMFWRTGSLDEGALPARLPVSEVYFPEFIRHLEDEVFLDGGAYDGDTIRAFLKRWPSFRLIQAHEPDAANFEKLHRFMESINGTEISKRLSISSAALYNEDGMLRFESRGTMSSNISETHGTAEIPAVSIDHMCVVLRPTYIKLDIEGSEAKALQGAKRTIAEARPVLAVCAYHKAQDLWELLQLLIDLCKPDYKFYLRRYGEQDVDLIYYAVPKERVIAA